MEDVLIIKYLKKKKEKGLEMLIEKYGGLITSIVKSRLYNFESYHDECIDDILLGIWNNIDSFNGKGSFKNWIGTICKYKTIDYKRKYLITKDNLDINEINIIDSKSSIEDIVLKKELKEEVNDILNSLNFKNRELFLKYYFHEESIELISADLDLTTPQIYNRLSKGRKFLKNIFITRNTW